MLKASAYPYPVFEAVEYELESAAYDRRQLERRTTSRGIVINGQQLRDRGSGNIAVSVKVLTPVRDVIQHVFGDLESVTAVSAFRVLCETSKYRAIHPVVPGDSIIIEIPIENVRGTVMILPVFTSSQDSTAVNGSAVIRGAIIALSNEPTIIVIDEDWLGDMIPVEWVDFATVQPSLPPEAFIHIVLPGSGELTPKAWLNERFRNDIESVLNHGMLNSPQGIAGHILRQFVWFRVWQAIVPWAIRHESEENENWPSTRIARMWQSRFGKSGWTLPGREELDPGMLEELSLKIQHCWMLGDELARVRDLWRF